MRSCRAGGLGLYPSPCPRPVVCCGRVSLVSLSPVPAPGHHRLNVGGARSRLSLSVSRVLSCFRSGRINGPPPPQNKWAGPAVCLSYLFLPAWVQTCPLAADVSPGDHDAKHVGLDHSFSTSGPRSRHSHLLLRTAAPKTPHRGPPQVLAGWDSPGSGKSRPTGPWGERGWAVWAAAAPQEATADSSEHLLERPFGQY